MFLATASENGRPDQRHIIKVRHPEWQRSWAVTLGRFIAFLPEAGDSGFYARLADQAREEKGGARLRGDVFEWPNEPFFGL